MTETPEGQLMIHGYDIISARGAARISNGVRAIGTVAFAALFGVVGVICSCLAVPASASSTHSATHSVPATGAVAVERGHDDGMMSPDSHGDHNQDMPCAHTSCAHPSGGDCSSDNATMLAGDVFLSLAAPVPSPEKILTDSLSILSGVANRVARERPGARWLHPPDETPVTRKDRLLN